MEHGLYRKIDKNKCRYCDHPVWCPSKKINAENKCRQCRKNSTKRNKRIKEE